MQDFTHENLDHAREASHRKPVVLLLHAKWCAPCQAMKAVIDELSEELGFTLIGIDAGENRAAAAEFSVRGVPAVVVLKDGERHAIGIGGKTSDQLRSFLAAAGVPA